MLAFGRLPALLALIGLLGVSQAKLHVYHLSDEHGWFYGHKHEPELDTNHGMLVSFIQRMTEKAAAEGDDVLFLDSGDWIQGTGLSDATDPAGTEIYPLVVDMANSMPNFFTTAGNHDIFVSDTAEWVSRNWTPNMTTQIVSFNTYVRDPVTGVETRLANPYTFYTLPQSGKRILFLGFVYEIEGKDGLYSRDISDIEQSSTFSYLIAQPFDALVILGHSGYHPSSTDYDSLYSAFRRRRPDIPILIFGGHAHSFQHFHPYTCRNNKCGNLKGFDDYSAFELESKCHLRIMTHVSLDITEDGMENYEYDPFNLTKAELYQRLGYSGTDEDFYTEDGLRIWKRIQTTLSELDLDQVQGYAPQYYGRSSNLLDPNNLWNLWMDHMVPEYLNPTDDEFTGDSGDYVHMSVSSFLPNDLFEGELVLDDIYIVMPYNNEFYVVTRNLTGQQIANVWCQLLGRDLSECDIESHRGQVYGHKESMVMWPEFNTLDPDHIYSLVSSDFDIKKISKAVGQLGYPNEYYSFGTWTPHILLREWVRGEWGEQNH